MKAFNLILALIFALFAAVQLNDPDPWGWVALYGWVAAVSVLAALGRRYPWQIYLGLAASIAGIAVWTPDFIGWIRTGMPTIAGSMKAEAPHIELAREFLGLLLAALVFSWHWHAHRQAARKQISAPAAGKQKNA
jgi:hypothetical protein